MISIKSIGFQIKERRMMGEPAGEEGIGGGDHGGGVLLVVYGAGRRGLIGHGRFWGSGGGRLGKRSRSGGQLG